MRVNQSQEAGTALLNPKHHEKSAKFGSRSVSVVDNESLQRKTPGDQLSNRTESLFQISLFGIDASNAYIARHLGSTVITASGLPSEITPSELSVDDLKALSESLQTPESKVKEMNDCIRSAMRHTIASEPIHKANERLGAPACTTFELQNLLKIRPGEEKCYYRVSCIQPRIELLPFENVLSFLKTFEVPDLTTLFLSFGIACIFKTGINITRNKQGEMALEFFRDYCFEPNVETVLDPYWPDQNEDGEESTAFALSFSSLYAALKLGYKHSVRYTLADDKELTCLSALLNGSLNILTVTECATSAEASIPTSLEPESLKSMRKEFSSQKLAHITFNGSAEVGAGAGIASSHLAIKDRLEVEGWLWPRRKLGLSSDIFKYRHSTTHKGSFSQFKGPSYLELSKSLNFNLVCASNILKQGEYGRDFWLLLYPFECEHIKDTVIASKKEQVSPDEALVEDTPTAFYNLILDCTKINLAVLKKSLSSAGVTNREVLNAIRSVMTSGSGEHSMLLEYTTEMYKRRLQDIEPSDYQLRSVAIYVKKCASAAPVGFRFDCNFKFLINKKDVGEVTFKSLVGHVEIKETQVELNISGSQTELSKFMGGQNQSSPSAVPAISRKPGNSSSHDQIQLLRLSNTNPQTG